MRHRTFLTGAGQSAANPAFAENLKRFEAFVQASDAGTRKLHAEFGIADGRIDGSLMLLSEAETALMRETFPDRELLSREATLERFPLIDPSLAFASSLLIPEDSTFNATFAAKLLLQRIAKSTARGLPAVIGQRLRKLFTAEVAQKRWRSAGTKGSRATL